MDSSGQVPNGATVILFDMLNTTADDQAEAVKQLADYLKTIGREERIALYILAQQLYVVQDFTGDPERLTQIAATIRASEQAGVELRSPSQLIGLLRPPNFTIGGSSSVWVVVPGAYSVAAASAVEQATATSAALEAIGRHLRGVPGTRISSGSLPVSLSHHRRLLDGREMQEAQQLRKLRTTFQHSSNGPRGP